MKIGTASSEKRWSTAGMGITKRASTTLIAASSAQPASVRVVIEWRAALGAAADVILDIKKPPIL